MRPARQRYAALLLGSGLTACAVYTDDALVPLGSTVGGAATAGGSAGKSGGGNFGGGMPSTTGGKPTGGSPTSQGGSAGSKSDGGEPQAAGGAGDERGGESAGGEAAGGADGEPGGGSGGSGGSGPGNVAGMAAGGNAGTGGKPATGPSCDDHPLTARSSWVLSSLPDYATGPAANLTDNKTTRWTTGQAQSGDEWLQVDFGQVVTLSQINLQQAEANANDYPRAFTITISNTDENVTGTSSFSGTGKSGVSTTILLPALATGRYLLIEQTGSSLSWWSAVELEVSCVDPD